MTDQILHSIIWRRVKNQHGVIARWQLLELGMSANAIKVRIANGGSTRCFAGPTRWGAQT